MDINELVQNILKECWDRLEKDKEYYRGKVKEFEEIRDRVRDQMKEIRNEKLEETQRELKKIIRQFNKTANQLDTVSISIGDSIVSD